MQENDILETVFEESVGISQSSWFEALRLKAHLQNIRKGVIKGKRRVTRELLTLRSMQSSSRKEVELSGTYPSSVQKVFVRTPKKGHPHLKEALTSSPILIVSTTGQAIYLWTLMPVMRCRAVLSQEIDGPERVVAYWITTSTATPPDPWSDEKVREDQMADPDIKPLIEFVGPPAINQVGRTSRLIVLQLSGIGPSGILYISGNGVLYRNSNQRMERHSGGN
ncbi:hypothetical protein TNCV_4612541 [Trichonephila clavipes]|nr:hypothetical protein TNCV_4612541 [Trichonephila clavipes]